MSGFVRSMQKMNVEYGIHSPKVIIQKCCSSFTKGTLFSSIFNLLTTCVGAGTLALPYAFAQGGIIFASVVFFLIMVMSIVVGLFLYDSKRYCNEVCSDIDVDGYEDLAEVAFGTFGRIIVLLTLIVLLFLSLMAYMIYTRDQLDFVIQFILTKTSNVPPECSMFVNCAVIMCLAFIPLFPILLLKKMTVLQFTSFISILCVVFVDVIVSVKSAEYFSNRNFTHKTITITASDLDENHIALFPGSLEKAITCISYCSLTYLCHFQLFSLEKELHRPKKWKLNFIVVASLILAYAIYNVMVFAAYLQFGGATKEDIMTNYPNDDPLVTAARILLFFTLLFSYPVLFHPTRAAINRLCNYCMELFQRRKGSTGVQESSVADETDMLLSSGNVPVYKWKIRRMASIESRLNAKPNFCVWICETWILFGATFLPAAVVPNVGYIWNFVGSIGGSLVLYIFPALFYIRLRYFSKVKAASEANTSLKAQYMQLSLWKDIVAFIILMTGIIVLVAGNYVAIKAIVSQSHTNIVSCYAFNCTFTNKSSHYY